MFRCCFDAFAGFVFVRFVLVEIPRLFVGNVQRVKVSAAPFVFGEFTKCQIQIAFFDVAANLGVVDGAKFVVQVDFTKSLKGFFVSVEIPLTAIAGGVLVFVYLFKVHAISLHGVPFLVVAVFTVVTVYTTTTTTSKVFSKKAGWF